MRKRGAIYKRECIYAKVCVCVRVYINVVVLIMGDWYAAGATDDDGDHDDDYTAKDSPHPQTPLALGLWNTNWEDSLSST